MTTPLLDARIVVRRPTFTVEVSLALAEAGVLSLYGPSGSGKTTILRTLAGLETNAEGHVRVGGADWSGLPPHRRRVAYAFQDQRLFPHLDARGNLEAGARLRGEAVDDRHTGEVAALLDLEELLDRPVDALSGGEAQRVAIGRCLLARPALLLLDEPLSAVDPERRAEILPYLQRLHDDRALPIVHVSHDWTEVLRLADEVVLLREGRAVDHGTPAAINAARRPAGAQTNLLEARVAHVLDDEHLLHLDVGGETLWVPGSGHAPGEAVRVLVDDREVALSRRRVEETSFLNVLPVEVMDWEDAGAAALCVRLTLTGDQAGQVIRSRITRRSAERLNLAPSMKAYALIKSVAIEGAAED